MFILLFNLLVFITKSQLSTIWFDDMDDNSAGWSIHNDVEFPDTSDGCWSYPSGGKCATCRATNGDSYLQRSTNVASYSSIQFQFDIWGWDLESSDECRVIYCYGSSSSCLNSGTTFSYGSGGDDAIQLNFGSPTHSTLWIRLAIHGDDSGAGDRCYFDTLYLRGIPAPAPTRHPTRKPSNNPTRKPTPSPTNNPTPAPTRNPTRAPTNNPTHIPTNKPTKSPIIGQTNNPTPAPTRSPTNMPTFSPSNKPTSKPTASESPTNTPSTADAFVTTTSPVIVSNQAVREQQNDNLFLDNLSLSIVIILILLFVCISCLLVLVMFKCYKHMKRVNNDVVILKKGAVQMNEMQRIQSVTSVTNTSNATNTMALSSSAEAAEPGTFDLQAWLNDIGLIEYYEIFVMNGFGDTGQTDGQIYSLNNADLKEMGILKVGHRKLILSQIKNDQQQLWRQHKISINNGKNYEAKQDIFADIADVKLNDYEGAANGIHVATNGGGDDDSNESETESSVHYTTNGAGGATTGWTIPVYEMNHYNR